MKGRKRILLLVVGAFLIAVPTVVIVIWILGPQLPYLTFELLVTLNYLSTEFSPLVAFAYLWFHIQPSFEWVWGLVIAMIIAVVVLAFLFYYVLPILSAEMKERKKLKSK
ncbi:MAG: hypothetical protein ACETWM_19390 [Candidatus Lokiarchaeia archaeon]